ncbi:MAG: tetratricopeptide repeat protein [Bradymonadaceae bacterium]
MLAINLNHRTKWHAVALVGLLCLLVAAMGCQDSPKDKLREGRSAIAAQNPDVAEARLNEALAADPNLIEARRLMADVHILRGDFQKAEETLQTLWTGHGFEKDDAQLQPEQRRHRQLINDQFSALYRGWAEALDSKENPDKFEEVLRKGLERDARSTRLNTLLVDHYSSRAERYIEQGEKVKAAEELEKIAGPGIRTFTERRQEANSRAANLRREAFVEAAKKRFESEIKPELVDAERFDEESGRILITVENEFPRRMSDVEQARAQTSPQLAPLIGALVVRIGGLGEDADMKKFTTPEIGIMDEDLTRGQYSLSAAFTLDGAIDTAFTYHETRRKAALEGDEAPAEAEKEGAEEAEEAEGSEEAEPEASAE